MFQENDYRFCTKVSLQVMQQLRENLCQDCIQLDPKIQSGLHSSDSPSTGKLYFQYYFVEWLNCHWEAMLKILEKYPDISLDSKRQVELFFASYFSKMISSFENNSILSDLAIPELLSEKKKQIEQLLSCSEKWEKNINILCAQKRKNNEQFQKLIQEAERNGKE